jgi:hypothetical protein
MKHLTYLLVLLAIFVTACTPTAVQQTTEVSPTEVLPTPTATLPPATPTATVTPTEVPISSLPVDELVQKFMAGDVEDISSLSMEQRMRFSQAYVEALNQKRGANPVVYKNQSYVDPLTGKFLDVNDGKSKQEQTIQMYLPAYENAEGYLMVQTSEGEWIQINGSKNIRYEITNDPFDPDINWPDTEKVQGDWIADANKDLAGLPIPQYILARKDHPTSMMPIVILGKELGEIRIGGFGLTGSLKGLIVEKDSQGHPIATRVVILSGGLALYGDGLAARSKGGLGELSTFWETLEENTLYYLMYETNQSQRFDDGYPQLNGEATADYSGLIPSDKTHQALTGQLNNNDDLIWISGDLLMKTNDEK